jgi:hypothetical protein
MFFESREIALDSKFAPKKSVRTFPLLPLVPAEQSKSSTWACDENPAAADTYNATRSASF